MDLSPLIAAFATGLYTVTRAAPSTVGVDGRAVQGAATTFEIQASVFPARGRELQRLPEGMRQKEHVLFYTTTPLQIIGAPDTISIRGVTYEVDSIEDWVSFGGDFYRVLAMRIGN